MPARLPFLKLPLFVALLTLPALLFAAGAARATPTSPVGAAAPLEALVEEEGEEEYEGEAEEETECETAEEEVEEGELTQDEADEICREEARENRRNASGSGGTAPEECILRSAHAHASLTSGDEKLKLTIGYTTYEPVTAKLQIGHLTTLHRHLGNSGVIRIVEGLSGSNPPKQLTVRIDLPSVKRAGCPSRRLVLFPR